jgi:hypothetical protein
VACGPPRRVAVPPVRRRVERGPPIG